MSDKKNAKQQVVNEIKEKFQRAEAVVLVDYRGLNVAEVTELRKRFREAGADYKVYKNTLMTRALTELGMEELIPYLTGPNAVALGYDDPVVPAKIISEFAKDHDKLEVKAGMISRKVIGAEGVKSLANLPSKEVLVAQALGGLNAPITGFVNVLQGNIRNLVYALNAIAEKKTA
ncbi:MAG: 50S ribosomal protein L10 [Clostridiales bacterium]|nr:50S ribosomal protein L10 [Clostridiales bacterium]HQD41547.1 50S ribosomal protein L10 [Bacillota bacterium]